MGSRSYIDPKTGKDTRYDLIPVMVADGKIERLGDIFLFIPKTTVAKDIGLRLDTWDRWMAKPELFPLRRLLQIAVVCGLTERQLMELVLAELEAKKRGNL